ncbi:MAG: polysaccharide biosynthesis/export family protein [Pyrinomonadaceae bacterium]
MRKTTCWPPLPFLLLLMTCTSAYAQVTAELQKPITSPASAPQPANVDRKSQAPAVALTRSPKSGIAETSTLTEVYRIGVGDILEVRLLNTLNDRATSLTVLNEGVIDLPVAGGPIIVSGYTLEEIQDRISSELKRRAIEATVAIGIRQYLSHPVVITGLVGLPGTKYLRREAVPLYVVLAEAQLRNDGDRVSIMRVGSPGQILDLSNAASLNTFIYPGDVITVSSRPPQYYYVGGHINYPGQKLFQPGITLLQAILAAGGQPRSGYNVVEISRESPDGRLTSTRVKMNDIKSGRVEDPRLEAGDRIEVLH